MFSLGTVSTLNIPDGFNVCHPEYGRAALATCGHARVYSMSDYTFWKWLMSPFPTPTLNYMKYTYWNGDVPDSPTRLQKVKGKDRISTG